MTLGRVAGERHSILSAARARTPPKVTAILLFLLNFSKRVKSRAARLLATFRMRATRKRYKHK